MEVKGREDFIQHASKIRITLQDGWGWGMVNYFHCLVKKQGESVRSRSRPRLV